MKKENNYFEEMQRQEKKAVLMQKALDKALELITTLNKIQSYYQFYESEGDKR